MTAGEPVDVAAELVAALAHPAARLLDETLVARLEAQDHPPGHARGTHGARQDEQRPKTMRSVE
jgi:hypothetical protein